MATDVGHRVWDAIWAKLLLPKVARRGGRCSHRDLGRRIQLIAGGVGCIVGTGFAIFLVLILPKGGSWSMVWSAAWLAAIVVVATLLTRPLYRSARHWLRPSHHDEKSRQDAEYRRRKQSRQATVNYLATSTVWIGGVLLTQKLLLSTAERLVESTELFWIGTALAYLLIYLLILTLIHWLGTNRD